MRLKRTQGLSTQIGLDGFGRMFIHRSCLEDKMIMSLKKQPHLMASYFTGECRETAVRCNVAAGERLAALDLILQSSW